MIKIYTAQTITEVELVRGVLQEQGIPSLVQNQYTVIGRGEIPITETWPQLWLFNEADFLRAQEIIGLSARDATETVPDWTCSGCGEEIEGQFSGCWNCGNGVSTSLR